MIEAAVLIGVMAAAIVIVLALLSAHASATSHPTKEELDWLTSAAPNESLIDYRTCNALIVDAVADLRASPLNALGSNGAAAGVSALLNWVSRQAGGLWVGGRAFLTSHRFIFMPNEMNRALHRDLRTLVFDLKDVTAVTDRFGVVTRIIDIKTQLGVFSIRAPDARAFARQIRSTLERR